MVLNYSHCVKNHNDPEHYGFFWIFFNLPKISKNLYSQNFKIYIKFFGFSKNELHNFWRKNFTQIANHIAIILMTILMNK